MSGYFPTDVAQQALDAAGIDFTIGELSEGTREAQVTLRAYGQCLRQLLRGANWDFARKQVPLFLLADKTGQTPDVGTQVPQPWMYEYAYPTDCAKMRFIPWIPPQGGPAAPAGNIAAPTTPLMTGLAVAPIAPNMKPAKFVITNDPNYPPQPGEEFWLVQGVSPLGRTVVCTNVKNAIAVYTMIMPYPNVWDPLFRQAMVSYLSSQIAFPLAKDKKFGLQKQTQQIAIAKGHIEAARAVDGNEGTYSSDIPVDWMNTRTTGGGYGWLDGGYGFGGHGWGGGWDRCSFADGSAY